MRGTRAAKAVVSGVLAAALGGCTLLDDVRYFRSGIGSELSDSHIAEVTELQNEYVNFICRTGGANAFQDAQGVTACDDWGIFVQAGMNDIDRRCDAYLNWLDEKRRTNEPLLKQLAAMSAATVGILEVAHSGLKPIAIVSIVFGFAGSSITNFNSALLSIDHSTIQATVIDNQNQFRNSNFGNSDQSKNANIDNRASAIYVLRRYLRICMPATILMNFNNTMTVYHRVGPGALKKSESPTTMAVKGDPTTLRISNPARDTSYRSLRAQLFPGGVLDRDLAAYVKALVGPKVAVGVILDDPRFVTLRQQISACIVAHNAGNDNACPAGSLSKFIQ